MTTIDITYGGSAIVLTANLTEASAPICIDGEATLYQTADARHRTIYAVALACRLTWPEGDWPRPEGGDVPDDFGADSQAWAEMAYETR